MNWKEVQIPELMADLPRDERGFPVPYIVARDAHGKPQFTTNDSMKVRGVIMRRQCSICGKLLGKDAWLVGGPGSAFHPRGAYLDPPIHHQCGTYALQVCPYLAMRNYHAMSDEKRMEMLESRFSGTALFVDPTADPNRPEYFVFTHIADWSVNASRYIIPQRPYLAVEFWKSGERIEMERPPGDTYPE